MLKLLKNIKFIFNRGLNKPLNVSLIMESGFFLDTIDNVDKLVTLSPILFHDNVPNCGLSGSFNSDDPVVTGQILYNFLARGLNLSTTIEYPRYENFKNSNLESMNPPYS